MPFDQSAHDLLLSDFFLSITPKRLNPSSIRNGNNFSMGCLPNNFTELLKELNEEDLKKEKEKSFQWSHWKESNKKEIPIIDLTHHPLTEDSCRNTPTNWDIYQLCKRKKYRVHMIFRKINIFLKNKQFNEIAKEKRNLFTWCNENSPCNNKKTTRFSSDVDLNERTPSIINEDCCEGATGIAPVDNQNVSTLLSNNCLTSLLDSNLQTSPLLPIKSLQTTATGASPSPPKENQPGINSSVSKPDSLQQGCTLSSSLWFSSFFPSSLHNSAYNRGIHFLPLFGYPFSFLYTIQLVTEIYAFFSSFPFSLNAG
ncbi:unnamed protein product [Acanthosepion pharaonis]|uniref:Uncharacterized protein n=1 Tax=Acanthosepion pharaonis TaxID=158019 RepID=A0A812BDQ8_ACAPH|nr:unnamed protein product [Sepia pharaonis]